MGHTSEAHGYSDSDDEDLKFQRQRRSLDDSEGSDLFYRLKLKLWNRDRITSCIRTPYDKHESKEDRACWPIGTRVVITEDGDMYCNRVGRLTEYRGKGWYAVFMDDGHKVCYNPMQFARCADQSGPPTTSQMYVDPFTQGNKKILNEPHFLQHGIVEGFRLLQANSSNNQRRCNGGTSNAQNGSSASNPPMGSRVRIVRTYGGSLLPRDEVKTGQTTGFVHGWYTITLDETSKTTNCRRSSFVIVGDEEDIALGFAEEKQEGKGSTKRGSGEDGKSGENDSVLSGQEENDRSCQHKSTRKRGRPSQKELAESKHRDGDEDGDEEEDGEEGDKRKKGRRMDDEVTNGRKKRVKSRDADTDKEHKESKEGKDEEETKREEASEERKRKEDKDRREEEGKQEPQLTQEERDALEAARLAAQLNRNPRRRGAERDVEIHLPLPRVPHKSRKKKEEKEERNDQGDVKG